jgi:hypothetical protein
VPDGSNTDEYMKNEVIVHSTQQMLEYEQANYPDDSFGQDEVIIHLVRPMPDGRS